MNEGVSGLWVGFPVFYFRVAPHAMIVKLLISIKSILYYILKIEFNNNGIFDWCLELFKVKIIIIKRMKFLK